MKKTIIILITILFITINIEGQNLFFIGEKSYHCTESITLQSNKKNSEDLIVLFAKDSKTSYFIVSTNSLLNAEFTGKLIIYLDDGTVVTSINSSETEYVDDTAKALFSLTKEQLSKLRKSNINTVRYTLMVLNLKEVNRSASNKGDSTKTNFPNLINEFFK